MEPEDKKYREGHFVGLWMGIGIAIFSGFGVALSLATDNFGLLGVGPAVGVAVGLSIGQAVENKYKKEDRIRPPTEEEKKRQRIAVLAGLVLFVLLAIIFLLTLLRWFAG